LFPNWHPFRLSYSLGQISPGEEASMLRKIAAVAVVVILVAAALFVTFVGPWPVYGPGHYQDADYYTEALAAISLQAQESEIGRSPGGLQAGWSAVSITPLWDLPLAGFGNRNGKLSTGTHEKIFTKAIALSDGSDTVVIVGADMLIVPPNVAEPVRERVAEQTPLTANDILFNANHSHSGPGGLAEGVIPNMFWGPYDPDIVPFLVDCMTQAIVEAYENLEDARIAQGSIETRDYIRNRVRDAGVDPALDWLLVEQADGDRCYLVRYSAHATVLGGSNMAWSGDYPGFVQRVIQAETGAEAIFLGGAVGSMSARAPEGPDMYARAEYLGQALAQRVLSDSAEPEFSDAVEIASVGVAIEPPPVQVRMLHPKWRFSALLPGMLGLPLEGWIGAVRIGDLILVGLPCDFSGEIAADLRSTYRAQGIELWTLSFNGAYLGYVSPDEYYLDIFDEDGDFIYETGVMSWTGPDQEALFNSLIEQMALALTTPASS
jgi:neutral ceramidase